MFKKFTQFLPFFCLIISVLILGLFAYFSYQKLAYPETSTIPTDTLILLGLVVAFLAYLNLKWVFGFFTKK